MENLNNVHLWKTPLTGRIVIGSVDSKKIVTAQRTLEENEIMNVLTDLIDYMQEKGIKIRDYLLAKREVVQWVVFFVAIFCVVLLTTYGGGGGFAYENF